MAKLNVSISTARTAATLARDLQRTDKYATVQAITRLLQSVLSGNDMNPVVTVSVDDNATPASGTVTLASATAADTVTINGVVFTAVSGTPTGNQFKVGVSDTADALSLVAAINGSASALVNQQVTAASALGVVTITSVFRGVAGNQTTLASSNGTRLAVSGARLASGAADSGAQTYLF